ncbi:MAG: DUF4384 domain-containing protein [Treponema sp.]|jgi:hypothetical protein|nr:DUF4384 domain-containing protein [Treponema sp.]
MKKQLLVFCFAAIAAVSLAAQDFSGNQVKKAVDGLAANLLRPLNVNIKEITLAGTNGMTSELSLKLYIMVKGHAVNLPSRFRVLEPTRGRPNNDEPSKGIISGIYTIKANTVEVTLELNIDGIVKGSQFFTIPMAELEGISVLPENYKTPEEAVRQDQNIAVLTGTDTPPANPAAQGNEAKAPRINIQAWFDSQMGNRVYMHREGLAMQLMADKDCYFKVIHIDANNQIKMIYPNAKDTNNRLWANESRKIFESASYMLYGPPYGAETILIVASAEKFENIEKDYIAPWTPATAQSVSAAIRGSRGELESNNKPTSQSGEGEARYTITVLTPHEEYSYARPEDMDEFQQAMRSQDELIDYNPISKSGVSVLNNVRVSFRIPSEAPDTMQFAIYYLDRFSGVRNARGQTRGAGYNFSFDKPGNIIQAVQSVKSGILGKGGAFTGDDRQGSFQVSGIAGQYRVADKVNVTITDKPVLIPNSLIEREVKNYFGK